MTKFSTYYVDLLGELVTKALKIVTDDSYIAFRLPGTLPVTPSQAFGVDPALLFLARRAMTCLVPTCKSRGKVNCRYHDCR